jgi:predicted PurR-regulated permease PerM
MNKRLKTWLPIMAAALGTFWTLYQVAPLLSPLAIAAIGTIGAVVMLSLPSK